MKRKSEPSPESRQ